MNVVIFLAYDVILLKGYHPVDKTMVYGFVYHREAPGLLSDFIIEHIGNLWLLNC